MSKKLIYKIFMLCVVLFSICFGMIKNASAAWIPCTTVNLNNREAFNADSYLSLSNGNSYSFHTPSGTKIWGYWIRGSTGDMSLTITIDGTPIQSGSGTIEWYQGGYTASSIVFSASGPGGGYPTSVSGVIVLAADMADAASVLAAKNAADAAKTSADAAKVSADAAKVSADSAATRTWYNGKYGGTAESAADIAGYIRNLQLPNLETKINNLQTSITNIQTPTITKVQGQNGATCTTGSTFTVVISVTPSSGASYRVTCGSFDSGWTSSNTITITSGIVSGANTATVQVKNAAGTTAQTTFTFFKV